MTYRRLPRSKRNATALCEQVLADLSTLHATWFPNAAPEDFHREIVAPLRAAALDPDELVRSMVGRRLLMPRSSGQQQVILELLAERGVREIRFVRFHDCFGQLLVAMVFALSGLTAAAQRDERLAWTLAEDAGYWLAQIPLNEMLHIAIENILRLSPGEQEVATGKVMAVIGRRGADSKHAKNRMMKAVVQQKWSDERTLWTGNKSAFAVHAVDFVKTQFDEPIRAKTIRESWLRGR